MDHPLTDLRLLSILLNNLPWNGACIDLLARFLVACDVAQATNLSILAVAYSNRAKY